MRRFCFFLIAIGLCGCQIFARKKTASGWYALEKAETVECGRWPVRSQDLQINDLTVIRGAKPGILASGLKRDGSPLYLYAPFNDDVSIDKEDLVQLTLGRSALIVGGASIAGTPAAAVAFNVKGKSNFELRQVKDNLVRAKGSLVASTVVSGSVTPVANGAWVLVKRDDGEQEALFVDWKQKDKIATKLAEGPRFKDQPVLVPQTTGSGVLAFTKEGDGDHPFKARAIGPDGKATPVAGVDLGVVNQVESWSATSSMGSYYVAMIDGDSLIGQANLRVGAFGWSDSGPSVKWSKDAPLKDVHVTEPVFLETPKGLQVLLLKWVDEESTIARYIVAGGTLGQPSFSGIFKKGARIIEAFSGADPDDSFVIVRHRDDTRWAFQICKI